jgi:hypothetical protein
MAQHKWLNFWLASTRHFSEKINTEINIENMFNFISYNRNEIYSHGMPLFTYQDGYDQ